VFVGTVVSLTDVSAEVDREGRKEARTVAYRVRLTIEEAFAGVDGQEIEVTTVSSTTACGYDFKSGERYLVYASRSSGELLPRVSLCSRTRPSDAAFDDLELLRAAQQGRSETRIFGSVWRSDHTSANAGGSTGLQSGVKIVATGNGQEFETVTDSSGWFRFTRLPLGQYTVRAWLNNHFSKEGRYAPTLSAQQGCAEVSFHFNAGARVAGSLTGPDGQPMAQATVVIKDVGLPKTVDAQNAGLFWAMTDRQGRYEIEALPPGRYSVGISSPQTSGADVPYLLVSPRQGTATARRAPLSVAPDQNLEGVDIQHPANIKLQTVSGVVRLPDGSPADAAVVVRDAAHGWLLQQVKVDADGRFALKLFVGQSYRIHAYNFQLGHHDDQHSQPLTVLVGRKVEPLELRLAWPPGHVRR
jgi:hypothetical protein